jgi:hypothetical protein
MRSFTGRQHHERQRQAAGDDDDDPLGRSVRDGDHAADSDEEMTKAAAMVVRLPARSSVGDDVQDAAGANW